MVEKKNTRSLVYIALRVLALIPLAYYFGYMIGKNAGERQRNIEATR